MKKARAIGLFDSGLGGLTVAEEVFRQMPGEEVIYFGDTAHVPYGSKTEQELIGFAQAIIGFLVAQGAKYIIFACNTSSSVSLSIMRRRYRVPMIGLVEPGAVAAARVTKNRRIGVIATEATVRSGAYRRAIQAACPGVRVYCQAAPLLVPLVEAGKVATPEAEAALRTYLAPLQRAGIDTLLLGCTHYPFFTPLINAILGPEVALVDPAAATVAAARQDMERRGILENSPPNPSHRFFVSGDAVEFAALAKNFLNRELPPVRQICLLEA
ncbi:MAG: glutamate racemase [Desulfotomaculales bacterium]